ncbi:MAG: hypothetical protein CL923_08400 [Deltaproteobacteria bacterium]|jgi:polyisoprenoid-binding protein YceI|nr:hypothetical protein [Deltaproteobacteria bacterium]MDP7318040.1 YceI family protein [SAR324 cluster bacterium]MDP7463557.1 YceI family protein [SAR324 cluster bacterium]MDP7631073.1 YceI family protein [SAR324 cluster bacterium]
MRFGEILAARQILAAAVFGFAALPGVNLLHAEEVFRQEDHCLAYRTEKTMFFFVDVEVVGKTCEIKSRVEKEGEQVQFEVSFPIRSLDSGNGFRDGDVAEILSVETHPDLRFVSTSLTLEQVRKVLKQGATELPGVLEFAGQPHPVRFPIELSRQSGAWVVTGKLVTSFTGLGLELPTVAGGVVADARDVLELLVHLRFDQVRGLEALQVVEEAQ